MLEGGAAAIAGPRDKSGNRPTAAAPTAPASAAGSSAAAAFGDSAALIISACSHAATPDSAAPPASNCAWAGCARARLPNDATVALLEMKPRYKAGAQHAAAHAKPTHRHLTTGLDGHDQQYQRGKRPRVDAAERLDGPRRDQQQHDQREPGQENPVMQFLFAQQLRRERCSRWRAASNNARPAP